MTVWMVGGGAFGATIVMALVNARSHIMIPTRAHGHSHALNKLILCVTPMDLQPTRITTLVYLSRPMVVLNHAIGAVPLTLDMDQLAVVRIQLTVYRTWFFN